jgi:two-component system response regulator FlrC
MKSAGEAMRAPIPGQTTLRAGARGPFAVPFPIYVSQAMRAVLEMAEDVADTNTTVLLLGESGTGKEVIARAIHRRSGRAEGEWVAVNCAALPAELLESELFGHERGAFTGAGERRIGKIEQADGGTLLLDEISELPLALQAKLLRVLQEREVDRVGGTRAQPVDVRVIATSNRDLLQMVNDKAFRADLYYRLCVFPIVLPPLRERLEDIPELAQHFLSRFAQEMNRPTPTLSDEARTVLGSYRYPGNVRELGNLIERVLVRCREPIVDGRHLGGLAAGEERRAPSSPDAVVRASADPNEILPGGLPIDLAALERLAILEALRRVNGNRTHAAKMLGISLRTLRNKLRLWRGEADGPDGKNLPSANHAGAKTGDGGMGSLLARSSQSELAEEDA